VPVSVSVSVPVSVPVPVPVPVPVSVPVPVPVSVHYRLCLVTVRMKVLQNGDLSDCWCAFSCSICNQTATSLAVSRVTVPKVMTTHIDRAKRGTVKGIAVY
jgi:hypothetical protein